MPLRNRCSKVLVVNGGGKDALLPSCDEESNLRFLLFVAVILILSSCVWWVGTFRYGMGVSLRGDDDRRGLVDDRSKEVVQCMVN